MILEEKSSDFYHCQRTRNWIWAKGSLRSSIGQVGVSNMCPYQHPSCMFCALTSSTWGSMRTVSVGDWFLRSLWEMKGKDWVFNSQSSTGRTCWKAMGCRARTTSKDGHAARFWNGRLTLFSLSSLRVFLSQNCQCCCCCHWLLQPRQIGVSLPTQTPISDIKLEGAGCGLGPLTRWEGRLILQARLTSHFERCDGTGAWSGHTEIVEGGYRASRTLTTERSTEAFCQGLESGDRVGCYEGGGRSGFRD